MTSPAAQATKAFNLQIREAQEEKLIQQEIKKQLIVGTQVARRDRADLILAPFRGTSTLLLTAYLLDCIDPRKALRLTESTSRQWEVVYTAQLISVVSQPGPLAMCQCKLRSDTPFVFWWHPPPP